MNQNQNQNKQQNRNRQNKRNRRRNRGGQQEMLMALMNALNVNKTRNGRRNQQTAVGETTSRRSGVARPVPNDVGPSQDLRPIAERVIKLARGRRQGRFAALGPETMGKTVESGLWAYKVVHPCADVETGVPFGIPDENSSNVVTFENRNLMQIGAPPTVVTTPSHKWGCIVYSTNFPEYPVMFRRFDDSADPTHAEGIFGQYGDIRAAGWGIMKANGMTKTIEWESASSFAFLEVPTSGARYSKFRHMYKGCTVHMDANALTNEGTVTCGNVGFTQDETTGVILFTDISGAEFSSLAGTSLNHIDINMPPVFDESTLMNQGASSINWPARNGVYMSHKFRQAISSIQYKQAADSYPGISSAVVAHTGPVEGYVLTNISKRGTTDDDPIAYKSSSNGTSDNQIPGSVSATNAVGYQYLVSHQSDLQPMVAIFRGLNSAATLNIKTIEGIEAQVNLTNESNAAVHTHRSPCPDDYALKLITEVQARVSGIYEARDNDLSDVIRKIAGVVRDVGSTLSTYLPGPWGIGAAAASAAAGLVASAV